MLHLIETINSFLSGPIMVVSVLSLGVILSFKTRFIQFRKLGYTCKYIISQMFIKPKVNNGISPFQALTTALSGTIGTGNIVGVATAISMGGAGAVFWMWISAFLGMATKYAEIVLAIKYRHQDNLGQYMGGPMYYMNKACKNKWLGVAFCILCLISSFGIGNMVQSNAVSQSINSIFTRLKIYIDIKPIILIIALIVGYITLGGIKRIAKATQAIVPAMALFYIFGCIFIIIINIKDLPNAFSYIIKSAFNIRSAGGGVCGFAISKAIKVGFTRGVFTNEAGLGSAPIAHAAAQTDHPARQGLWGIFEVFFDTIIMCTLTGLVIVISKSYDCGLAGADMTFFAFGKYLGDFAYFFIAISTIFFAVSTIIGWGYYGQTCIRFLSKSKTAILSYKLIYIIVIYIGAVIEADLVWGLSDLFNSLMMIPNLFAILMLADEVKNITKDFEHKIKKKEL